MKIYVLVKQVPDTETKIKLNAGSTGIDESDVKWIMSPYDEFAVEEALKTKAAHSGSEVTVFTVGPDRAKETLRTALAMGCDHAVHVQSGDDFLETTLVARALAEAIKKEGTPDLIFAGKQGIDLDQGATFAYLAELLSIPSVSVVVKCDVKADSVTVEREVEGGAIHTIEMPLPALIATNKGINTPRYASIPGIMKAKKKPIKGYALSDVGVMVSEATVEVAEYQMPQEKPPGKILSGEIPEQVKELVRLLREEAKVI